MTFASQNDEMSEINSLLDKAILDRLTRLRILKQNTETEGKTTVQQALNPLAASSLGTILASDISVLKARIEHQEKYVLPFLPPFQALRKTVTDSFHKEQKGVLINMFDITYKECKELENDYHNLRNINEERTAHLNKLREKLEAQKRKRKVILEEKRAELETEAELSQQLLLKLKGNMADILEETSVPDGYLGFDTILSALSGALVSGKDGSYIDITSDMWVPCLEFLYKYNIVIRHPRDSRKIRLVDFSDGMVRTKNPAQPNK